MNEILEGVKVKITTNSNKNAEFIKAITQEKGMFAIKPPKIENLEACMHELHVAMSMKQNEINY